MSIAVTALGALVGYLGAEVAESHIFERTLWPERFYNFVGFATATQLAFLMPMGGPLHRAALQTLDKFRDKGLYKGPQQGDMLGTAFFPNRSDVPYYPRSEAAGAHGQIPKEIRNGFWINVLEAVGTKIRQPLKRASNDGALGENRDFTQARSIKPIFVLRLESISTEDVRHSFQEEEKTWKTFLGIFLSEMTSIMLAIASAAWCISGVSYGEDRKSVV